MTRKILPFRKTIQRFRLDSFLSFAPGSEPIELEPLNVLIGPYRLGDLWRMGELGANP